MGRWPDADRAVDRGARPPRASMAARSSSTASPLIVPVYDTPRAVNEMAAPSTLPFSMAMGVSAAAAACGAFDRAGEHVAVLAERVDAAARPAAGFRPPQARDALAGRFSLPNRDLRAEFHGFRQDRDGGGLKPGDVASTVISPAYLVDCTKAMQRPLNAFARASPIGLVIGGVAVAGSNHLALP